MNNFPINFPLLVDIASDHLFGRMPITFNETRLLCGTLMGVIKLREMFGTLPPNKIVSETRIKQILAEYMKQCYERDCLLE